MSGLFFTVVTSHGLRDTCDTLAEAEDIAAWHNDGYMHGTQYASDPKPRIIECRPIMAYANGEEVDV